MTQFSHTVTIDGAGATGGDHREARLGAGCDDATSGTSGALRTAGLDREAAGPAEAVAPPG